MALKKYIKVDGWDVLDEFYDKEVKGVHVVVENFDRVFCKCGETHASEGGIVHKCPKCGNTDFIEYNNSNDYYTYPLPDKVKYEGDDSLCPDIYKIKRIRIYGECSRDRETLIFKKEVSDEVEFTETSVNILGSSSRRRYRDSVPMELVKMWPHFKTYEKILNDEGTTLGLGALKRVCEKRENYKEALTDDLYVQYPNLGKTVMDEVLDLEESGHALPHGKSFEFYLNHFKIDKSFLGVYDYYDKTHKNSYSNIFETYGYYAKGKTHYEELQSFRDSKCVGYEILEKYIRNGMLDLDIALNLIRSLNDFYSANPKFENADYNFYYRRNPSSFKKDFSDEELDLLPVYIKENITLKNPRNLPYDFLNDIKILRSLKIPVTEENLKVKNLNYYLNKNKLAEVYKLPSDKIECFIDWFEKNPLKAIQLVENRRRLTKKQIDAFIEEISAE